MPEEEWEPKKEWSKIIKNEDSRKIHVSCSIKYNQISPVGVPKEPLKVSMREKKIVFKYTPDLGNRNSS